MNAFLDRNAEAIIVGIVSSIIFTGGIAFFRKIYRYGYNQGRLEGERLKKWRDMLRQDVPPEARAELFQYIQLEMLADLSAISGALFFYLYFGMAALAGSIVGLAMKEPFLSYISMAGFIPAVGGMFLSRSRMIVEANAQKMILEELRLQLNKRYGSEMPSKSIRT